MALQKLFSVTAKNQLQLTALLMRGNQWLVVLLLLTFRVVRNPLREFWIGTTLKLFENLFRLWAYKPKDSVTKEQWTDTISSIPCNDCDNEYIGQTKRLSLVHVWKSIRKRSSLAKKKILALSEYTCLTNHTIGWDKSKIISTNRRYHRRSYKSWW